MPFLRLHRVRAEDGADDTPNAPLTFVAATAGMKGDGVDLAKLPWDFTRGVTGDNGPRFPFLWVHDLGGQRLPLGVTEVTSGEKDYPLQVMVTLDPDDEFAQQVGRKYRSPVGGLEAVSVSWDDVDAEGIPARASGKKAVAHQLLEVSAVPVGLDPQALQAGERAAFRALRQELDDLLGAEEGEGKPAGAREFISESDLLSGKARADLMRALLGSDEDHRDNVLDAIKDSGLFGKSYVWSMGTFTDEGYIVVQVCPEDWSSPSKYYRIDYTEDAAGVVTLGDTTQVDIAQVVVERAARAASADEDPWIEAAAGMVSVFDRRSEDSDELRRRSYTALVPAYRILGKTPPEWLDGAELRALDDGNWRALFLAGEIEAVDKRVGAELSARNSTELSEIRDAAAQCRKDLVAVEKRLTTLLERVQSKKSETSDEGDDADTQQDPDTSRGLNLDAISAWLDERQAAETAAGDNPT